MINAKMIRPHSDMVGMVGALGEQLAGAVPALELVAEQEGMAEKDAEILMGDPFASMVTPVNVYEPPPSEAAATTPVASPERFKVPLAG